MPSHSHVDVYTGGDYGDVLFDAVGRTERGTSERLRRFLDEASVRGQGSTLQQALVPASHTIYPRPPPGLSNAAGMATAGDTLSSTGAIITSARYVNITISIKTYFCSYNTIVRPQLPLSSSSLHPAPTCARRDKQQHTLLLRTLNAYTYFSPRCLTIIFTHPIALRPCHTNHVTPTVYNNLRTPSQTPAALMPLSSTSSSTTELTGVCRTPTSSSCSSCVTQDRI